MIILFICYHNFTTSSYHNYQLFKFHHYHYHPLYHQHHHFSFILRLSQHSNNDYNTHHSLKKLSHRYHLSSLSTSSSKTSSSSSSSSSFQLYQSISPSDEIIDPVIYSSDLYEVLGLLRNASKAQIKDAYWTIASRNHPDR